MAIAVRGMHGAVLFFILAFLVFFVYSTYAPTAPHTYKLEVPVAAGSKKEKEGFAGAAAAIPCAAPNDPPGSLPTAPYGGISENVPRPAFDPSLQPTTAARVKTVLDDLRGFENFEMPQLEERSDPNIQLPLSTLKGDIQTLMNEALVLQRNPGLRSTITELQMAEIEANLDYLRQVYRKFAGLGVVEPRRATKVLREGFSASGSCGSGSDSGSCGSAAPSTCGSGSGSGSGSCASDTGTAKASTRPATLDELKEFRTWIFANRLTLINTGATDEVTTARINNFTKILTYIDNLIDKVTLKKMLAKDIPVKFADINDFKSLGTLGSKLPAFMEASKLPTFLNNILPDNLAEDPEISDEIRKAMANYATNFTNNFSWSIDLGLKYTADNEAEAAKYYNNRANQGGNAGWTTTGLNSTSDATAFQPAAAGTAGMATDEYANKPEECSRGPSRFDWKQRSTDICRAIKARGLDPNDYGCMEPGVSVGPNFSWRGYAKMVCTRVGTNYDSGLGQMVGCPPLNWPGWKV